MSEEKGGRLVKWFLEGGGFLNPSMTLSLSPSYGLLFQATERINPNSKACSCPLSFSLSYLNVLPSPPGNVRCCSAESVCSGLIGKLSEAAVGSFFLAEQRLKGLQSFWQPYIDALPKESGLTTPLWFDENDLLWLKGTNLYSSTVALEQTLVEMKRASYKAAWKAGISILKENGVDTEKFTWELCLWAATIFSSRSFTSDIIKKSEKESFPLLYPVIDCFNHRFGAKVTWNMDHGNFSLVLEEAIDEGDQVFNNYAPKGNEELLMGYGFCVAKNPCDQVSIRFGKPPPAMHDALKAAMPSYYTSNDWDPAEATFYVRGRNHYSGGYPNTLGLPCLRGLSTECVLTAQTIVSLSMQADPSEEPLEEGELWHATIDVLHLRLDEKRNTILQSISTLPPSPQNRRQEMAKIYRDGQLTILHEVIEELDTFLQSIEEEQ